MNPATPVGVTVTVCMPVLVVVCAVPASFCFRSRVIVWNDAEVAGKFVIETIPTDPD